MIPMQSTLYIGSHLHLKHITVLNSYISVYKTSDISNQTSKNHLGLATWFSQALIRILGISTSLSTVSKIRYNSVARMLSRPCYLRSIFRGSALRWFTTSLSEIEKSRLEVWRHYSLVRSPYWRIQTTAIRCAHELNLLEIHPR